MNPDKEYLFVGRNGQRIGSSAFRERLKGLCTKLGVEYAPPHKIRKTYASIKAVNGVGDAQNSKELGHADITTTKRLYEKDYFTKAERRKTNNMAVNY